MGEYFQKEKLMPRRILYLLLFLALVLSACKPGRLAETATAKIAPTETAKEVKAPVTTPSPTTPPKQPATLQVPEQASVPGCTVVSFFPTPDPSSLFPQITTEDWYRGPLTATVKIIEYSDFQ